MATLRRADEALEALSVPEILRIEPRGTDSVRVRAGRHRILNDLPGALLPTKPSNASISVTTRRGEVSNRGYGLLWTGLPPMRPLFVDFPEDATALTVEDEFMLGPDLLVAPVLQPQASIRELCLPAGTDWIEVATGNAFAGGQLTRIDAPLGRPPLFARAGRDLPVRW